MSAPRSGSIAKKPMSARSSATASTDLAAVSKVEQLERRRPSRSAKRARQVDRDAARRAGDGIGAGEDRIAQVDGGAQLTGRRETGDDVFLPVHIVSSGPPLSRSRGHDLGGGKGDPIDPDAASPAEVVQTRGWLPRSTHGCRRSLHPRQLLRARPRRLFRAVAPGSRAGAEVAVLQRAARRRARPRRRRARRASRRRAVRRQHRARRRRADRAGVRRAPVRRLLAAARRRSRDPARRGDRPRTAGAATSPSRARAARRSRAAATARRRSGRCCARC